MGLSRRQLWTLMIVGVVIGGVGVPVAADMLGNTAPVDGGVPLAAPDGPTVVLDGETRVSLDEESSTFPAPDTVVVASQDGTIDVSGPDGSRATVHADDIEGEWTRATGMDTSGGELTLDPADKQAVTVSGPVESAEFRDAVLDDGTNDIVLGVEGGSAVGLTVGGLPSGERVALVDSQSNENVDVSEVGPDGEADFSFSGSGETAFKLRTSGGPPVFDEHSMSPSDDEVQSSTEVELSVDVDDPDFPATDVEVNFYVESSYVGTDTLSDAGTASVTTDDHDAAGVHEWHAVAEDDFGQETTSPTETFGFPDEVEIRDETEPEELITDVDVDVIFYFERDSDTVHERTATDGTVDMEGLPVDEPFVVVARADAYFNRRIFVGSLIETQEVYLLNESATSVQPTFTLTDFTGEYDRENTVVEIQKSIDDEWRTVEGDYFGAANEMTAQLSYNERHRLVIRNVETGATRDLGAFTPTTTTTINLEVHHDDSVIRVGDVPVISVLPEVSSLPAEKGVQMTADVDPIDTEVDEYTVRAVLDDGTVLHEETHSGFQAGEHEFEVDLDGHEGGELTVWVEWTNEDGTTGEAPTTYSIRQTFNERFALLPVVEGIPDEEPPNDLTIMLTVLLALLATGLSAVRMETGASGIAGLAVLTAGTVIGWIPVGWLIAAVMAWFAVTAVRQRM